MPDFVRLGDWTTLRTVVRPRCSEACKALSSLVPDGTFHCATGSVWSGI